MAARSRTAGPCCAAGSSLDTRDRRQEEARPSRLGTAPFPEIQVRCGNYAAMQTGIGFGLATLWDGVSREEFRYATRRPQTSPNGTSGKSSSFPNPQLNPQYPNCYSASRLL